MTLQECKDQVAKKYGFENWKEYLAFMNHVRTLPSKREAAYDEVAEFYLRVNTRIN